MGDGSSPMGDGNSPIGDGSSPTGEGTKLHIRDLPSAHQGDSILLLQLPDLE